MQQILKTDALVVHGSRWSDTSKIVHLFTAEKGYVKVIAKGALRPKSQFRGVLENLNAVEVVISLRESRGLQVITQASLQNAFNNIRDDLNSSAVAFSVLELIREFIHYNENVTDLFSFTISLLDSLNQSTRENVPMAFLLQFMLYLSSYLGFGWDFETCISCKKEPAAFPLSIDVANGAIVCADCRSRVASGFKLSTPQWQFLKSLQNSESSTIPQLVKAYLPANHFQSLLDILIAHLNYHTEQRVQLKSLKMYLP